MNEINEENVIQDDRPVEVVDPCTVNIANLPQGEKPYQKINGKPLTSIFVIFIIGILLLIFVPSTWFLSVFMIGLSIVSFVVTRSFIQFEFYNNYFVIYPVKEDGTCLKINWSDVLEWTVAESQGSSNALTLRLDNPSRVKIIPIYSTNAVYGAMNKKVADKETTHQKREAFRKKTSNWKWFWQKDKK